ncbi:MULTISPECIES: DASH family cryptochrome [Modicisalibacter]|uniref:Cryptochrome DASH n=1 Tax=Modicisalibacter tunisiensis TaxID=390637 RepID=A0ABS7WZT4_9GAMM|nr:MULTISPECIES: DASH family cryptochrome [Modicisalibacter]MBZ9567366.1 DASH family cryptochrome [Modicisalibacter tunisiensis]
MSRVLVWLRNDLRVADNPLWCVDTPAETMLCVYVLDRRWLTPWRPGDARARIGPARLRFLWESLMALRGELLVRGSDLLVCVGDPVDELQGVLRRAPADVIRVREDPGWQESDDVQRLASRLPSAVKLETVSGGTLFTREQLPFSPGALPDTFSAFRRRVAGLAPRPSRMAPVTLPPWPDEAPRGLPPLARVSPEAAGWRVDPLGGPWPEGGERAGRERLQRFLAGPLDHYRDTRNALLGDDVSSRLSPWLAWGCLSAGQVMAQLAERPADDDAAVTASREAFVDELLWREYFHWAARQDGAALFGEHRLPVAHEPALEAWCAGATGVPFIDAAMRELVGTGWLSNRARQNVASFLVKDLQVDWRLGAAWFERWLVDYDAASNWENWRYVAGGGRDPRRDRYFNVMRQALRYDADGDYVAHWLPDLASLPPGPARHAPWRHRPARFGRPWVEPEAWRTVMTSSAVVTGQ